MTAKKLITSYPTLVHEDNALKTVKAVNSAGTGSDLPEYVGWTAPGSATSAAAWRIKKITYDANDKITDIQWADGNIGDDKIFDDRASYSYS